MKKSGFDLGKWGPVAVMMFCTGVAFGWADTYENIGTWTQIQEVTAATEEDLDAVSVDEEETVPDVSEAVETIADTEEEAPESGFYLAEIVPEGMDESLAQMLLDELSKKDTAWFEEISKTAKYGIGGSGSAKVKVTSIIYKDGDGNRQTAVSNVDEILAMASVYAEETGITEYADVREYVKELWSDSHSCNVTQSEVYYCTDCTDDEAEDEVEDEAGGSDGLDAEIDSLADGFSDDAESRSDIEVSTGSAEESDTETLETVELDENLGPVIEILSGQSSVKETEDISKSQTGEIIIEGSGPNAGPGANIGPTAKEEEKVVAPTAAPRPEMITGPGVVMATGSDAVESAAAESSLEDGMENTGSESGSHADDSTGAGNSGAQSSADTQASASVGSTTVASTAARADTAIAGSGSGTAVSGNVSGTKEKTNTKSKNTETKKCPGHVDITIEATIETFLGENNLFTMDTIGNSAAESGLWSGWTAENQEKAMALEAADWYHEHGIYGKILTTKAPLTNAEIETYMELFTDGCNENRQNVIRFALESVGRVPYYWGGKPSGTGYDNGRFTKTNEPDKKGRTTSGLDCSGWINWVYWSATANRLPYEGTDGLCSLGTAVSISDLQPGDLAIRTGDNSHVVIYLGTTADGKRLCVHESSYSGTVAVSEMNTNWGYYRNLLN